mgnify:CR=1 FL=1
MLHLQQARERTHDSCQRSLEAHCALCARWNALKGRDQVRGLAIRLPNL